ncbi:BadF/BadG/BcrA/BcrD ATPase family protein [Pseudoduganella sp. GCM10020061]|uniref:BadF/BadG/BcrA/BcrD ATPase family protein n=1 Tax=Pseudoduganella sp. GCM10020061 TaxID=3317345 RepID=UPI00362B0188
MIEYLIGADGGGTGTRVRLARPDGAELALGTAGPSGLSLGIASAWAAVNSAIDAAFAAANVQRPDNAAIAVGAGLAGVHNKQQAEAFTAANPGFARLLLETDAFTTLLGAHGGKPGAIVAVGTGSVGEVLLPTGERREVGGWGFPAGDEAGGCWLGLKAVGHIEQVLDCRQPASAFASELIEACGGGRDGLFAWLAAANQTAYARLAPIVIAHGASDDVAHAMLRDAGREVERMAHALDPSAALPLALCGGLGEALRPYLSPAFAARARAPQGDSAFGALCLVRQAMEEC